VAFGFAASAPFALHVGDLFAAEPTRVAVASASTNEPTQASTLGGPAIAIEGDLLEIAGKRIRLYGIDAPEMKQSCRVMIFAWGCGEEAQKMLSALIADRPVTCVERARDADGVPAALCQTDGVRLNETMVRIGMALSIPSEPQSFAAEEAAAERAGVGLWRSSFEKPWEWRAANAK
jgi:endonuclease YncB( thermonuclease family)